MLRTLLYLIFFSFQSIRLMYPEIVMYIIRPCMHIFVGYTHMPTHARARAYRSSRKALEREREKRKKNLLPFFNMKFRAFHNLMCRKASKKNQMRISLLLCIHIQEFAGCICMCVNVRSNIEKNSSIA